MNAAAQIIEDVRAETERAWKAAHAVGTDREPSETTTPAASPTEAPTATTTGPALNLPASFWEARPFLTQIRDAAWSRMTSPDAVLAAVLARYAALVPPTLRLPASIGSAATFDLIACNIGTSSAGKSIAADVGSDLVPTDREDVRLGLPVGSGEGLVQAFFVPEVDDAGKPTGRQVIGYNAVHFTVDEGTALMEQSQRSGTTIVQTLCSAWSGRELGQTNAKAENRRIIEARRVRCAAVINLQTANGHLVLSDQMCAIGLPQRITFAHAHDPNMPGVDELPDWPGPLNYSTPPTIITGSTITVDAAIVREVRLHRHAVATGAATEAPLDGHRNLMRLKVAGLFSMLEGDDTITPETWQLAGTLVATSARIRDHLVAVKTADDAIRRQRSADGRADYEAHVDDVKERKAVARLTDALIRRVTETGGDGIGRADLRRTSTSASTRHRFDDALRQAVERGALTEQEGRIRVA